MTLPLVGPLLDNKILILLFSDSFMSFGYFLSLKYSQILFHTLHDLFLFTIVFNSENKQE